MNGYLMDTNHVVAWEEERSTLIAKLQSVPNDMIFASAITLGEISAGHEMSSGDDRRRLLVDRFLSLYLIPNAIPISHNTRTYYGKIMGRIWQRHPPASSRKRTELHLVEQGLGINDVWIVAMAWERGLIFLTTDAMPWIRESVPEVTFDNWL